MKFIVLIAVGCSLLGGCGTQDGKNPLTLANSNGGASNPVAPSPTPQQDNNAPEMIYAIALQSTSDLPTCDEPHLKELAYVKAEAKFYSCESTGWAALSIQGPKGDQGDAGTAGTQGPKGDKGDKGDTGLPGNSNAWYDVQTQFTWFLGGGVHFDAASSTCANGWRMATSTEGVKAMQDGVGSRGISNMWVSDADSTAGEAYIISGTSISSKTSVVTSSTYDVACIQIP